jgi:2',3'-cyclic-nucleotide 2'-phosphodiesterase (5'-nucleotidase family)
VERGGAQIGIIGAIGDCYSSISKEVSGGFYFKTGSVLTELVKAEAKKLRENGADFIVYSVHDGHGSSSSSAGNISDSQLRGYYDPVLSDGYVDIVFEGHSHKNYVLKDSEGVYHLQGGGDNRGLCHAEAVINFANGQSKVQTAEFIRSSVYENMADDPIVDNLLDKYEDQVSVGSQVLGTNAVKRYSSELCQIVADLYLKAGVEAFGAEYDIVLGGGFLSARSPYNLSAGQVTYSQLQTIFPFDNDLVLCSIKGSDLQKRFINTSDDRYYAGYSDYGREVKDHLDPNGTYYVIVDSYTSTYAPNRLTEVARYTSGVYARDLLAEYVQAGGLN